MSAESDGTFWTVVGSIAIVLGVRIVDWILPTGGHFHTPWIHDDEEEQDEQDY